jgi:hypothetical protein
MKLVVPSVVKTETVFVPVYEEQTFWQKLFRRPKRVALTEPRATVSVGNCTIETATELALLSKFDYKFGTKLYVGIKPFMSVREGRYRCTVDEILDQI